MEWQWQRENGNYINLFENDYFKRDLHEWDHYFLRLKFKKNMAATLRDPLTGPLQNAHTDFHGLSASIGIHRYERVGRGRYIRAEQHIAFGEKIAECDAYVGVADQTKFGYCVTCTGEMPNRTTPRPRRGDCRDVFRGEKCNTCRELIFCSQQCKNNDTTHEYECETFYDSIVFGDKIIIKCSIQMVFKALSIFQSFQRLKDEVNRIITDENFNGVPTRVFSDEEKFECVLRLQATRYKGLERDCVEAFCLIMQLPRIQQLVT